jgi:hypothetical protein
MLPISLPSAQAAELAGGVVAGRDRLRGIEVSRDRRGVCGEPVVPVAFGVTVAAIGAVEGAPTVNFVKG